MRRCLLVLIFTLMLSACQQADPVLPTLVPEVVDLPSEVPPASETPRPTARPSLTPEPTQPLILGRFASDPAKIGFVRIVHAAPDTGAVDIYVEGVNLASTINFQQVTGRTNVIAGEYTVAITEAGVKPAEATLAQFPLKLSVGQSLILVFSGIPGALSISAYEESNEPLEPNQSRVNFIHVVPLAPLMKGQQNSVDLSPLFDFGQQSGSIVVSPGRSTLSFASSEQTLASYTGELFALTNYTLVLIGRSDELDKLTVLSFNNTVPSLSLMRVINMADTSVDVYLDNQPLVQNVNYASASERLKKATGTHLVNVFAAGADPASATPLLQDVQLNAAVGDNLALIVLGKADALRLLVFKEDLSPLTPNTARIAYINANPDVPVAEIGNSGSIRTDIGRVGFAQSSAYFPMDAGTYRIFWQRADDVGGLVEDIENFNFEEGLNYLYMLTGDSENPVIFTDAVSTAQEVLGLPTSEGGEIVVATATRRPVTRIRVINAIDEVMAIDLLVNGTPVATDLSPGQGTLFAEVPTGTFSVTIRVYDLETNEFQREFRLLDIHDYSLFVYGPSYDPQLHAFDDSQLVIDPELTGIRLINLSRDEALSVGLIDAPATDPSAPVEQSTPGVDNPPPMIPVGTLYITNAVRSLQSSLPLSTLTGVHDLIVSDNRTGVVAQRIRGFNFEMGAHYDVIVTYPPALNKIQVFLLRYPN